MIQKILTCGGMDCTLLYFQNDFFDSKYTKKIFRQIFRRFFCRTAVGRPSDGRRTTVGSRRTAVGSRRTPTARDKKSIYRVPPLSFSIRCSGFEPIHSSRIVGCTNCFFHDFWSHRPQDKCI